MTDETPFGRRAAVIRTPGPPPRTMPQSLAFRAPLIDAEMKAEWAARAAPRPMPVLTSAIIAGLAIIFACEYGFNVGPIQGGAPATNTMIALGASGRSLVIGAGEPWRLVTAVLLHINPAHIIGNAIVLYLAGAMLERLVGRAWLGATFVVSGLAGSIAALCFDPPNGISLGASGAIMGVLSATFVCTFHPYAATLRRTIRYGCAWVAIPALIPFSRVEGAEQIGYNAHGGGFLAGVAIGLVMLKLWPLTEAFPGRRPLAANVGWAGLVAAVVSFLMVALHYPAYAKAGEPYAATLPSLNAKAMHDPNTGDQTLALVRLYPHDPRTHLLRSVYLLDTGDLTQAAAESRAGIAERDALSHDFPDVEPKLHLLLALILVEEGIRSEAEPEAEPWCSQHYQDLETEELREELLGTGLCGGWQADR